MQNVWMLSPFTTDTNGNPYPMCSAYTSGWQVPWNPAAAGVTVPIAHVQSINSGLITAATSKTVTFTTPTIPGNLVVVSVLRYSTGTALSTLTCTDAGGNVYVNPQDADVIGSNSSPAYDAFSNFYAVATSSTTNVTITSGTTFSILWVSIHEYSGVDSVRPLNATNAGYSGIIVNTTGATLTIPLPIAQSGELIFACGGVPNYAPLTIGAGYTSRGSVANDMYRVQEEELISSGGIINVVYNSNGIYTSSGRLWGYAFAFKQKVVPTGLGLVYCQVTPSQIAAAKADPTIVVLSTNLQVPAPLSVTNSYYYTGAIIGMSLGSLLTMLGALDPNWLCDPNIQTTPPGISYFIPARSSGVKQDDLNIAARGIGISMFVLPYAVTFSNIYMPLPNPADGGDVVTLHSFGVYDLEGNLIVASTAQVYPLNGMFPVSPTTLAVGMYYAAWTSNGNLGGTYGLVVPGGADYTMLIPAWATQGTNTLSSALAVLPSKLLPPTMLNVTPVAGSPRIMMGFC